jgi:hypothetical protein
MLAIIYCYFLFTPENMFQRYCSKALWVRSRLSRPANKYTLDLDSKPGLPVLCI